MPAKVLTNNDLKTIMEKTSALIKAIKAGKSYVVKDLIAELDLKYKTKTIVSTALTYRKLSVLIELLKHPTVRAFLSKLESESGALIVNSLELCKDAKNYRVIYEVLDSVAVAEQRSIPPCLKDNESIKEVVAYRNRRANTMFLWPQQLANGLNARAIELGLTKGSKLRDGLPYEIIAKILSLALGRNYPITERELLKLVKDNPRYKSRAACGAP